MAQNSAASWRPWPSLLLLALALGTSVLAHGWGLGGDLPYAPDVDEPIFVRAAIQVAEGHLSPGWFGNPASTLIYPVAGLIRLWYATREPASLLDVSAPELTTLLADEPAPLYLIARLVSAAYGVGAVLLTWLIARRLAGPWAATFAALALSATWLVVSYGQLARADTAGLLFGLLFVVLLLRALDRSRRRDWIIAGAAIGVAVSSRYFMAALGLPYLVAWWLARRRPSPGEGTEASGSPPEPSLATLAGSVAAAAATFLVTSPAIPLHIPAVIEDLVFEARSVHPGADGLSPLANAAWYALDVLPAAVGPVMVALAFAGAVALARRRPRTLLVLGAFAIAYVATVSLSPLHWDRYVIPLVPVVAILAGVALASLPAAMGWVARAIGANETAPPVVSDDRRATAAARIGPTRLAASATALALALVVLAPAALAVVERNSRLATPSTRAIATAWLEDTVAPGTLVCEEMYTTYAPGGGIEVFRVFALADEPMQAYLDRGCRYLLESSAMADRFRDAARYPRESAFYEALPSAALLVQTFEPGPRGRGPIIRAYLLDG